MSNQIQLTGGAKVRSLEGVITGTSGVLSSVPLGAANGVATLDSGGKVPVSQLPSSVVTYLGTWNAATNTPTLTNGTGDAGDMYICNVAGTVNFGAGPITFAVGDWVLYGSGTWQKSSGQNGTVTSVAASITGNAIGITGSPITTAGTLAFAFAGTSGQYINGAGNLVTFPTIVTEAQRLVTEVYNETGATLSKGTVVYINGGHGNLPTVTKAIATGDSTSAQTYGVVQTDITNMNNGYVVVVGSLTDLDTQAYPDGTQLYLSSTTAGAWTSTKQYAPAHLVYVGIVVRSHPTQGVVEVRIQNGFELDELHNVSAQTPSNGNILQYVSSTQLWTAVAGTTTNIAEGTNLYYTDARSRAAFSETVTGLDYNSTTGVLSTTTGYGIPTTIKQSNWDDAYTWVAAFPTQTGNSGKFLTTDGSTLSWAANPLGTVTSVAMTVPTGLSISGSPITTSGTLAVSLAAGYSIPTTASQSNWDTAYTNRITSATSPLSITSNVISISQANGTTNGYLSSTDWTTFNNKQATITLTTTGSSGAATFTSNTLNIPNYGSALSGYLPLTGGTLTGALNINLSSGTALNVAGNAIFRGDTGVGTPRQLIISSGGSTPVYLEAKGYGANYGTDFGIRTYNNVGTAFEVFYATSAGYVGINQTSPSYQLDVNGTGRFSDKVTLNGAYSNTSDVALIVSASIPAINLRTSSTGRFTIASNYSNPNTTSFLVGTGTSNPSTQAILLDHSTGAATFSSSVTATNVILSATGYLGFGGGTNYIEGDNANNIIRIGTNNTTKVTINGSGNVGIGTTSPNEKLDVNGAIQFRGDTQGYGSTTSVGMIDFYAGNARILSFGADGSTYGGFDFYSAKQNNGGGKSVMRINTSGNVGIGTSSPVFLLDVRGQGYFATASGTSQLTLGDSTNGTTSAIATSNNNTIFYPNGSTEGMRLSSSRNLLVGNSSDVGYRLFVDGGSSSGGLFYSTSAASQLKAAGTSPAITFSNTITSPTIGGSLGMATAANAFLTGTAAGDMIMINQFTGNKLYITNYSGGVYLTQGATSWTANSDIRIKNINSYITNAVEKLSTLQTINFSYKDDISKKENLGLIAQEVQMIFPELVETNNNGILGVRYTELVPVLIKAVQELKAEIETLKNK